MSHRSLRGARLATTSIFFVTGAIFASYAARLPAVQHDLGLSAGSLGVAALGLEGGAVLGLPAGGALVARHGSRRSLRLAFLFYPSALVGVALAPGLGWLVAALAVMAMANSVIDVAMNAQGVELERRYERPVLSGLHAGHSFGLLAGGLLGTAAAAAGVAVELHFAAIAAIGLAIATVVLAALLDEPRTAGRPVLIRPRGRLAVLGLVAFCAFFLDGAANNWSAVNLRQEHDAAAGLAAATFSVYAVSVALVRLLGDHIIERLGRIRAVQLGGAVAAAGAITTVIAPTAPAAIAGWALLGAGGAIIAPAVIGAAPAAGGGSVGVDIAAVTTVGYLGSFTGAPLIGAIASVSDLSIALLAPAVAAATAVMLSRAALKSSSHAAACDTHV